jgi:hypothetical protein
VPEAYPNPTLGGPCQGLLPTSAILAVGGLKLPSLAGTPGAHIHGQILLGVVVTAVAAYLSVRFLLRSFRTRALAPFAIYCLAFGGLQRHPLRHMTQGKNVTATAVPGSGPGTKGRHGFARIRVAAAAGTGVSGRPGWRAAPGCGTASRGGERTASEQHESLPGLHFRDVWPWR